MEKRMEKISKESKEEIKLEEARKISVRESCFSTVQGGFGEAYVSPFAVAINSSNSEIALLTSIPNLLGPLSQVVGSRLIEKYSRKKIVLFAVLGQLLIWIPIIAIAFLFWRGIWVSILPLMLIVSISVYAVLGNLGSPAWFSWMGDIVPEEIRGKYFSMRGRINGIIAVICTITSAFFLDFFKKHSLLLLGFMIFFFIAMLGRIISRELFKKQYEPKFKLHDGYYFSFWQFIKKAYFNNFGRFTLFRALIGFTSAIASPFFAVYMLRSLNFSYVAFMAVSISASMFTIIIMPLWGKFSDKFGNYEVIKITSILISIVPMLWLFSKSPVYLIFVPELISGLGWAGFNLATGNYIYDCVTKEKRGIAVSYYNLIHGVGVFLGAILGAVLISKISWGFMNVFLVIFFISGIGRLAASLIMIPKIKEVRNVKTFNSNHVFKHLLFRFFKTPNSPHIGLFGKESRT